MATQTSATSGIRVDFIPQGEHGLAGQLGMTFAPGKKANSLRARAAPGGAGASAAVSQSAYEIFGTAFIPAARA